MPYYEYKCKQCDHIQALVLKIDDRKRPEQMTCPECKDGVVKRYITHTPRIVSGVGETTKLMSNGWKEVMSGVSNANPNNNIKDY